MSAPTRDERRTAALLEAQREKKAVVGRALPENGAIVLAVHELEHRRTIWHHEYIVLAVNDGSYQPFVVWTRIVGIEQRADGRNFGTIAYCIGGHYFRDLGEAHIEFTDRTDPSAT